MLKIFRQNKVTYDSLKTVVQGALVFKWGMPATGRTSEWQDMYLLYMSDIGTGLECTMRVHICSHEGIYYISLREKTEDF